jgi:hypothetical protein
MRSSHQRSHWLRGSELQSALTSHISADFPHTGGLIAWKEDNFGEVAGEGMPPPSCRQPPRPRARPCKLALIDYADHCMPISYVVFQVCKRAAAVLQTWLHPSARATEQLEPDRDQVGAGIIKTAVSAPCAHRIRAGCLSANVQRGTWPGTGKAACPTLSARSRIAKVHFSEVKPRGSNQGPAPSRRIWPGRRAEWRCRTPASPLKAHPCPKAASRRPGIPPRQPRRRRAAR